MPARSKAQRKAMAIAEHHPSKLYKRNRGMLSMTKGQLTEFASTAEKNLPAKKRRHRRFKKGGITVEAYD